MWIDGFDGTRPEISENTIDVSQSRRGVSAFGKIGYIHFFAGMGIVKMQGPGWIDLCFFIFSMDR